MVTDLAEPFRMSLPAVSKHLKVLEGAHLIERAVNGRVHRCSLAPQTLRQAERWLEGYRAFWNSKLDSLATYVEAEKRQSKI
jgi:DNA-binding transcriptional ArsR family regulator